MMSKIQNNSSLEARSSTKKVWVELFITGIFLIFLLESVFALNNPTAPDTQDTQTAKSGMLITVTNVTNVTQITKSPLADTATSAWIQDSYTNVLAYAPFVGDNATFNFQLVTGKAYWILINNNGSAYHDVYNTAASYPSTTANLVWEAGVPQTGGNITSQSYSIFSIDLDVFPPSPFINVTLNSPANNSQKVVGNILFNSTEMPSPQQTLTNATLYVWFANGTLYDNTNTNTTFDGNISTFTENLSLSTSWIWNVLGVQGNGAGTNSSFALGNFTLSTDSLTFYGSNFAATALEQTTQTFKINISLASGFTISSANLTYNNTNYSASFSVINATDYLLSTTLTTPSVTADINKTFKWTVLLTDSSFHLSVNANQTVNNFGIDNCSTNTIQIMNLSLADEDTQTLLNATNDNSSIKIDLSLYPNGSLITPTFQFSKFYNETLPARVCISAALGTSSFFMNTQIEYTATNYADEFYNIQNYSLNASSNPSENMTLLDLLAVRDQVFEITYRDSNFLPVSGALIQIGRKYVDEGVTKTVEVPITDTNGKTVSNLVLNTVVYTFTVTRNGQVLAVFSDQLAKCQNPTITTCAIDLNSFSSSITNSNFTKINDFVFTLTYDKTTRAVSSTFVIPSGAVSNVLLNVTGADTLSSFLCSQNITTSSGTLTCTIPAAFGNQTAYATLYKNGVQVAFGQINTNDQPSNIWGGILIFIGIFAVLTLVGAAISDSPVYTGIFLIVGFGLIVALDLVANNGFLGATATILYLVVAIILIIIKGGKRT